MVKRWELGIICQLELSLALIHPLYSTGNGRRETGDEEAAVRMGEDAARSRQRLAHPITEQG